jgi:integrase/recombinase XerD
MTDEAMSPLRRRMIEDMAIRKLAKKTQQDYIQIIKKLAAFLGRSPDTATFEDLRRFQLHVVASGVGTAAINRHVSALRFFFRVTLKRYAIVEHTHFIHEPRKLPVVLSHQEVARLLDAAPGLKYKAALSVAYGAGLRAAEVVSLKVTDVDSKRISAWSRAKAARTATSCCHRICSTCCASGGRRRDHKVGSFRAAIRCSR